MSNWLEVISERAKIEELGLDFSYPYVLTCYLSPSFVGFRFYLLYCGCWPYGSMFGWETDSDEKMMRAKAIVPDPAERLKRLIVSIKK